MPGERWQKFKMCSQLRTNPKTRFARCEVADGPYE